MAVPLDGPLIDGLSGFEVIGRGGFGIVYRARQDALNRDVAVKVLNVSGLGDTARRRFDREQQTLGSVSNHPAIVTLHDSGFTDDGLPYLVMELMTGGSLGDRLASGEGIPSDEAISITERVSTGLQVAHDRGIIHRDIKPENILISEYGEPKLADFGIATLLEGTATMTTSVTTTVEHAAPEILEGGDPSPATDVYSLGSTLYALLTGRSPFRQESGESMISILKRAVTEEPPDLRNRGIADHVAATVEAAMRRDPAHRIPTAADLARQLTTQSDVAAAVGTEPDLETRLPRPEQPAPKEVEPRPETDIPEKPSSPKESESKKAEPPKPDPDPTDVRAAPTETDSRRTLVGIGAAAVIGAVVIAFLAFSSGGDPEIGTQQGDVSGNRLIFSGVLRDDLLCNITGQIEAMVLDDDIYVCTGNDVQGASSSFYIQQGFGVDDAILSAEEMVARGTEVTLEIDGALQDPYIWLQDLFSPAGTPVLWFEYSFPEGFTGTHDFLVTWVWEGQFAGSSAIEVQFE